MQVTQIIDAFAYDIYGALRALLAVWAASTTRFCSIAASRKSRSPHPRPLHSASPRAGPGRQVGCRRRSSSRPSVLAHGVGPVDGRRPRRTGTRGSPRLNSFWSWSSTPKSSPAWKIAWPRSPRSSGWGPLLGLPSGTVAGHDWSLGRIGGSEKVNLTALASDISLALWATGAGLLDRHPNDDPGQRLSTPSSADSATAPSASSKISSKSSSSSSIKIRACGASRSGTVRAVLPR